MSDGITDSVSYEQRDFDAWKEREIKSFLSKTTKEELNTELCKRDRVHCIEQCMGDSMKIMGAGTIIVVRK